MNQLVMSDGLDTLEVDLYEDNFGVTQCPKYGV